MEIICASICYRGYSEDEVATTLEKAPAIGYQSLEIHGPMTGSVDSVKALDLDALSRRITASGIRCAGLYTPGWGGADDADVEARAWAIARCVEYTQALGGDHISTTGAQKRTVPGALDRVLACVRKVVTLIPSDTPIKLALEPHLGNVLEQPEDFAYILDAVDDPRLGLCIDTGHFHAACVNMVEMIHRFAPRIFAVHLKDHIGATSVGIGRGEIDLLTVIAALREVNYKGDLTVELEVDDPQNLPRYTKEAYFYLSGMLGQKLHPI